jgi:hypothetical protein
MASLPKAIPRSVLHSSGNEGGSTMTITTPQSTTSVPTTRTWRGRRVGLAILAVLAVVILLEISWAGMKLVSSKQVTAQGVAVGIPGGLVTVDSVEHALPEELGTDLPAGTHVVAVTMKITGADSAALVLATPEFVIEGLRIPGAVEPSNWAPVVASVPAGSTVTTTAMYAVPDDSDELVLDLPGDGRISAAHDGHPGAAAE